MEMLQRQIETTDGQIDALVYELYGLTEEEVGIIENDQVEAVGKQVEQFKPGDELFTACSSAFAEYVSVTEDKLAMKPTNLTFEQAAAVPTAALTAWLSGDWDELCALRDRLPLAV